MAYMLVAEHCERWRNSAGSGGGVVLREIKPPDLSGLHQMVRFSGSATWGEPRAFWPRATRRVKQKHLYKRVNNVVSGDSDSHTIIFVQVVKGFDAQNAGSNTFLILGPDNRVHPAQVQGPAFPPPTKRAKEPWVGGGLEVGKSRLDDSVSCLAGGTTKATVKKTRLW